MALTKDEETFIKELKLEKEVENNISVLNETAVLEIEVKRQEIKNIQDKLIADVQKEKDKIK